MRFFDRFIYKNPKKQIEKHGEINGIFIVNLNDFLFLLEILRKKSRHAAGRIYLPRGAKAVPVDSNDYVKLNSSNIPADERFLYTFVIEQNEEQILV